MVMHVPMKSGSVLGCRGVVQLIVVMVVHALHVLYFCGAHESDADVLEPLQKTAQYAVCAWCQIFPYITHQPSTPPAHAHTNTKHVAHTCRIWCSDKSLHCEAWKKKGKCDDDNSRQKNVMPKCRTTCEFKGQMNYENWKHENLTEGDGM